MLVNVNWSVILLAAAVNFLLTYLWFGPLLGKRWLKEIGKEKSELPQGKSRIAYLFVYSILVSVLL